MKPLSLTVIIPTLERPETVLATVTSLEDQTLSGFEMIVLDQSTEESPELRDYKSASFSYRYRHIDEQGLPNARNVAAILASGVILVFMDDDVKPNGDLVQHYSDLLNDPNGPLWLVGGRIHEKGSVIFREGEGFSGGKITAYGKTLKNFETDDEGECQWVTGGNFAVLRSRFVQVGGFDTNFIGNAMLEDADFSFRIRAAGGRVIYSPLPSLEHLRVATGGTRRFPRDRSMYFRSHNTVYFFRKHMSLWLLPLVFFYLNAVALKNLLNREHSPLAFIYTWLGYIRGFFTPRAKGSALPAE